MFRIALSLFLLFSITFAGSLQVTISGIEKSGGSMMIALFDNEEAYNSQKGKVDSSIVKVTGAETIEVTFESVKDGTYAIKVYHDLNENGELDMGMFGPKEPYGFSNNVRPKLRAASFEEASFTVSNNHSISITIK